MNTPDHCSDDTINQIWDGGPILPTEIPASALNVETMFSGATDRLIDLHRKYDFEFVEFPSKPRVWACRDLLTFDPDPESDWHLVGYGATKGDAQADLLEQIAYWAARS